MTAIKESVQGKEKLAANERAQASLLHATCEDFAASLGLPKGRILERLSHKLFIIYFISLVKI
jgi:hypothetical protein